MTRARPPAPALFAALAGCLLASCGNGDLQIDSARGDAFRKPRLWTPFDLMDALRAGGSVAVSDSFPQGFPASQFLTATDQGAQLRVLPAYSEGEPAAFVVTDIWANVDEVWLQPLYQLLTVYDDKPPSQNRLKEGDGRTNAAPIFDVGPKSLFYSPFWQVLYAVVPPGTFADDITSSDQILDAKMPIYAGGSFLCSLRPAELTGDTKLRHPTLGVEIGVLASRAGGWLDGEKIPYFDQGSGYRYDENAVVQEVPLFFLSVRDAAGHPKPLDVPQVMGSGPLFSRRPPDLAGGAPRFGSYSRVHFAIVPPTAAAFDPAQHPELVEVLATNMIDPNTYAGRVARNAIKVAESDRPCFVPETFPMGCQWLDGQTNIEDLLGKANIQRTEITMASALVVYGGKAIAR